MVHILDLYESSKFLNKENASIFFSPNTQTYIRTNIIQIQGVKDIGSFEKYLGLPAINVTQKARSFKSLLDKVWTKISNQKNLYLSAAGKEKLIKAVLQAISTYIIGVF